MKPTPGRVPAAKTEGITYLVPEAAMKDRTGPLARRVEDLALVMEILSSPASMMKAPVRPQEP